MLAIRNIVSTLFLAETRYDPEQLSDQLAALFEGEEDKRAVSLFLNWFRQLAAHGRIAQEANGALETVYRSTEEVRGMLIKALAQEKERFFQEGLEQGREKERPEVVLAMYRRNFEPATIADIVDLPVAEIAEIIAKSIETNE